MTTTFSGPVRSTNGFLGSVTGDTTGNVTGIIFDSVQNLSGAGAVNITTGLTQYTSTGAGQALTLANGSAVGQVKRIVHTVDGGSGILTPTTAIGFTTITFTNVGDSVQLEYTTTGWAVTGSKGVTIA
jgi:hypothetical protein